jgi:lipoprotein Spr
MVKQILPAFAFILFLSSCSSLKSLSFTNQKKVEAENFNQKAVSFIEDITVTPPPQAIDKTQAKTQPAVTVPQKPVPQPVKKSNVIEEVLAARAESRVENASAVELKYAQLMDTEVEALPSRELLETVDDWYGVRYRVGGNTHKGVDCSGFTVAVYASLYGLTIPRVSREQYRVSKKLSTTELQEGDLVFFDTRGRGYVSHVGIYLGNNKFIHASVSRGVMVNDLFENYYLRRYVGGGRIETKNTAKASTGSTDLRP